MSAYCPIIETERLRLRDFREDDHPAYAAFLADVDATRYIGGPFGERQAWRVMAAYIGHWHWRGYGPFAVADRESDEFIGYCGPWYPYGKPEPEIMWGIVPARWRRGFASEAARAARHWAYTEAAWPGAVSYIMPDNIASQGVAQRLGARREGAHDHDGVEVEGWRHPSAADLRNAGAPA